MAEKEISSANYEMGKAHYDLESVYKPRFNPLLVKCFSGIGSQQVPAIHEKYAFFTPEEYLPPQVLIGIKNTEQAKKAAIFFKDKGEQITGVSVSSNGYFSKVYTISPDMTIRVWGKKSEKRVRFSFI